MLRILLPSLLPHRVPWWKIPFERAALAVFDLGRARLVID